MGFSLIKFVVPKTTMIYPNRQAALDAIRDFQVRVEAIRTELGIWEECEDSCCATYAYAQYLADDGITVLTASY